MSNYIQYHIHTSYSLLDSVTPFKDYADKAVEYGMTAIGCSEHGNIFNWVSKENYAHKVGLKFLYGCEVYLTRTNDPELRTRDNYHTILYARNAAGRKELTTLISQSFQRDHFYYKPRITFEEFLKTSDNIISTSACLASPLNVLDEDDPWFEKLLRKYTFLEVQPHEKSSDQMFYNMKLAKLSKRENIPLICGTDVHALDDYQFECRKLLMARKHIGYGLEDEFDLTFRTYDEILEKFSIQNALTSDEYRNALDNTNALADMIEDVEIDTAIKYPIITGSAESDKAEYYRLLDEKFEQKVDDGRIEWCDAEEYKEALKEENRVFSVLGMEGYMLFMAKLLDWAHSHGIPTGPGRGSVGGSRAAYVLDITDIDPSRFNTIFSRFCNEFRKEQPDIDTDIPPDRRDEIFKYIIDTFGQKNCAFILTFTSCDKKGAIDEIVGGLAELWKMKNLHEAELKHMKRCIEDLKNDKILDHKDVNEAKIAKLTKDIKKLSAQDKITAEGNPYSIAFGKKVKAAFEADEEAAKKNYPEIAYYLDGILNTPLSQSVHPAGIVASPITLNDNYGTIIGNDGRTIIQLDMDDVHYVNLIKYDLLSLINVEIIDDACKLAGIEYPKVESIDLNDSAVWDDIVKSPVGIFQFESPFAFQTLRKMHPRSIDDLALLTAALRPSGESYRNDIAERKIHKNPSAIIDNLLKQNYGYLVFQEDTSRFLQEVCGFDPSNADTVRRAIGHKDADAIAAALPAILDGYCNMSDLPRAEAEEEAKEFLKIIEDSASYQFNRSHAIGYSIVSYFCAYLRCHYPYEFIISYLNRSKTQEDIAKGTDLAREYGINVVRPKFGVAKADYSYDKAAKAIYKGAGSVKYLNKNLANQLFALYHATDGIENMSFMKLCELISNNTNIDTRQFKILIQIMYFSDYGEINKLLAIYDAYLEMKCGNIIQISKASSLKCVDGIDLSLYANDRKKDGTESKNWTVTDSDGLMAAVEKHIIDSDIKPASITECMEYQKENLGYVNIATSNANDRRKLIISKVTPISGKNNGAVWSYRLDTLSIYSGKESVLYVRRNVWDKMPLKKNDVINCGDLFKNDRGYWQLQSYCVC